MEGESLEESMEGVGTAGGEVLAEPVSTDIFHLVFVGQWGNGASRVVFGESLVEKHKVCESPTNRNGWLLECGEVCLVAG